MKRVPQLWELYPGLFIRGHTRHVDHYALLTLLQRQHVVLVLNVALIMDSVFAKLLDASGIMYRHVPLSDSRKHVPGSFIQMQAQFVSCAMLRGSVLVHCDSGWNRSALIAIAALHLHTRLPVVELIAKARNVRPGVLNNKNFERYLLQLGESDAPKLLSNFVL